VAVQLPDPWLTESLREPEVPLVVLWLAPLVVLENVELMPLLLPEPEPVSFHEPLSVPPKDAVESPEAEVEDSVEPDCVPLVGIQAEPSDERLESSVSENVSLADAFSDPVPEAVKWLLPEAEPE
jgi:hypothetical protein